MASLLKSEVIEFLSVLLYYTLVPIILLIIVLFVEGGISAQDIFKQQDFYVALLIGSVLVMLILSLGRTFAPESKFWGVFDIHNPEGGLLGKNKITKFLSSKINTIFVFLILFGFLFLSSTLQTNFFIPTPPEQQVTDTGRLIASTYPGAPAETMLFLSIIFVLIGIANYYIFSRIKDSGERSGVEAVVKLIVIAPLIGLFGVLFHLARYGGLEFSLLFVFFFWTIGALLTLILSSILPFLIMHDLNNFILRASQLFAKDSVIFGIIGSLILITALFIAYQFLKKKVRRK